ncbi:type II toxin-antitoxin system HicA family toxin [Methylobacterium nodulans]|uniref:YcfA family protein n=1 Tax=Methylobacterium nodulans (strain LMG 21967 / CNCM I-2342 / ORS 2060) TaxID=460265 RepID=B8IUD8_METNO|nr:type II toxin-antitoxin system HicA family toxin [Methylobacterium nodulans]ACL55183.1 YcfA family protein [Methylobacterium nodulans ORS 2060]
MSGRKRSRKTRDVIAALFKDDWELYRKGPGDHIQFKHQNKLGKVTVDNGEPEIPTGTLRNIYRQAGWEW